MQLLIFATVLASAGAATAVTNTGKTPSNDHCAAKRALHSADVLYSISPTALPLQDRDSHLLHATSWMIQKQHQHAVQHRRHYCPICAHSARKLAAATCCSLPMQCTAQCVLPRCFYMTANPKPHSIKQPPNPELPGPVRSNTPTSSNRVAALYVQPQILKASQLQSTQRTSSCNRQPAAGSRLTAHSLRCSCYAKRQSCSSSN
jgi:hypothetical protein